MIKRMFDLVFSAAGLLLLFPLLLLIGVIIKIGSPGPVFYRGTRTGRFGRPFRIYKFRTMVVDAEKRGGASTALNDPRLTSIGKFLRKYKFDELPQLINIATGEMSFVGPRPQVEQYTRLYNDEEKVILTVRPGLTDYASIRFIHLDKILGDDRADEKYLKEIEPEKNRLRVKYAKENSLWIDGKILIQTFIQLFKIKSLWNTKNLG